MKTKAVVLWSLAIAVVLFGVFVMPFLIWNNQTATPLNIWIVNKTVPDSTYKEHKGLMWVLNSEKLVLESTGKSLRYDRDYFGVFPKSDEEYQVREIPQAKEMPALIYLADTDGVYPSDFNGVASDAIYAGVAQQPLVGDLSEAELASIKNNLGGGNTIIGEFNIWDANSQQGLQDIFRVSFTGWSGKYFMDLTKDVEIPEIIVNNYQKQTGKSWDYNGGGLVLVSNQDQVLVLKDREALNKDGVSLTFDKRGQNEFGVGGRFRYEQWFDLIKPNASSETLATLNLNVTEAGKAALAEFGLATDYAAITRSINSQYTAYYFAGDFAQLDFPGTLWNYAGFARIKQLFSVANPNAETKFYWGCYVPLMQQIIAGIRTKPEISKTEQLTAGTQMEARTSGTGFQVLVDGNWEDFYSKGVNIGSTVPGKWFTEFSYDEALYLKWFEQIGAMHANTIRVYTLLPPQFYSALVYYNEQHPEAKLWLYQEIWPEEHPADNNYLGSEYNATYQAEIKMNVDAMHGQANIGQRQGRAYGYYTADVSRYIIGYLVGREMEPEEVISTNEKNPGFVFNGNYLYSEANASPTEAWLAMSCDYVMQYQEDTYSWQHPVGIVSWPTLDPTEHDSEWNESGDKSKQYNDKVSVDINHISMKDKLQSGFFGAYHIYPNYPDFMNNETKYAAYADEEGIFRYGGYLQEFIAGHQKYPAIVAEFGLATGMGNAHENPDGYHHGGMTEATQGVGIIRMMKAIEKEGYAGAIIFEWADEWAKKTWITEPYIIPYDRNPLWHNAVDPEQNYGIYAMETDGPRSLPYVIEDDGVISKMSLVADEAYLYIDLELDRSIDFSSEKLIIGLDTYDRGRGNMKFGTGIATAAGSGLEYLIEINGGDQGLLLVQPNYNSSSGKHASAYSADGIFETMSMLINKDTVTKDGAKIDAVVEDLSQLTFGTLENNSHHQVYISDKSLSIRIPWTRINVTDPSNMRVVDDPRIIPSPTTNELQTVITEGILVSGLLVKQDSNQTIAGIGLSNQQAFVWENWDVPNFKERPKDSYAIISQYFEELKNK
ncbi:hypothetical protein [uncultured Acetobacterium sp.]|uniref:hypothetical protein n=1 Tax=uncultured Acetobacterium sp. TaxID=217139 RepID=UPI002426D5BF|nr:hypothetical protein [uncultured Acetobacterium sp.]MBU4540170.1 hypothetical protein [Bacillota bacterium]